MPPKMADAVTAVAEPAARPATAPESYAWIRPQDWCCLAEAVQDSFEDVANVGFHIDLLGNVESHFFEFHKVWSLRDYIVT